MDDRRILPILLIIVLVIGLLGDDIGMKDAKVDAGLILLGVIAFGMVASLELKMLELTQKSKPRRRKKE